MTVNLRTSARTAMAQGIITDAGSNARAQLYNGTEPAGVSPVTGGNTLLATITFGPTIGTATNGTIDWDEAGATQNNALHVNGTPTFCDIVTSGGAVVGRLSSPADWGFSGTVVNGQNVTLNSLVWTMPGA